MYMGVDVEIGVEEGGQCIAHDVVSSMQCIFLKSCAHGYVRSVIAMSLAVWVCSEALLT